MQVSVAGKGVDVGESFRTQAEERLQAGIQKYLDRVVSVDVVVSKRGHEFVINIHGNTGTSSNLIIKSTGASPDIYAALDDAADKIEKQLRRYKRRLTDHHKQPTSETIEHFNATKYVIPASTAEEDSGDEQSATVIAEKNTPISTLTVKEAVMRMDLAELPALMFRNAANGRLNVVYKRVDGNISWVDPAEEGAASPKGSKAA